MAHTPLSRSRRISQEGAQQRSGVLASAPARRLGPWQEGLGMAAVRRALMERRQRDPALLVRGASVRHT
jgi:hypothetical protein